MIYHQSCRECKRILTLEEMDLHLQDGLGLCNNCREAKKHAETFKERFEELGEEGKDVQVAD
jgi:NAD-dependent SIR2 family protein deacetylase